MRRRDFILGFGGTAILARSARAQTTEIIRRIAVLSPSATTIEEIRTVVFPELAKMGFAEGRNLMVTTHVGTQSELSQLARQALALMPDVIIASTNASVRAILEHSTTVPIVMAFAGEDPVATGLAKSLARPGGSVTGLTNQAAEIAAKNVSLLHEAVPTARRIGALVLPPPRHLDSIREMQRVAQRLGVTLEPFYAQGPSEHETAFAAMRAAGIEAMACAAAPEYIRDGAIIGRLALAAGLPTIGDATSMARDGWLIGYGLDRVVFRRRAADFVARILRGTPPGELPIEQPTVYEMALNLATARKLGLTLPQSIIARADEVLE